MRYRIKDYTVQPVAGGVWLYFTAPQGVELSSDPDSEIETFIQEAIRLVIDESEGIVLCSSMQKRVYLERAKCTPSTREVRLLFALPEGETVSSVSVFTIEMDWGDTPGASPSADTLAAFFGLPEALPSGYEFMTETEVTDELEDIMQALDPELTETVEYPEGSGTYMTKAQAITAQAMNIINPSES